MKTPNTFLVAFVAAGLLMLVHAWLPWALGMAFIIGLMGCLIGGFAVLAIVVGTEFTGRRKLRLGSLIVVGTILALLTLTWLFDIFPYLWCGVAALVLGGCLAWQAGRDYLGMFLRRKPPVGPANWRSLEAGELPATDSAAANHAKDRFTHSYGVHGKCTPRAGAMGLISHPLKMDE